MGTYTGQDKRLQYLFQNGGGGGGGTNVEANPQGTPTDFLSTIKIGNNIFDVGKIGDIYSNTERQVGVWTDGKPLYQKTIDCGYAPNNTTKSVAHGISNIDEIVNHVGSGWSSVNSTYYPIPFVQRSNAINQIQLSVGRTSIDISTGSNIFTAVNIRITIQYTKTTDTAGSGIYVPSGAYAMHYSTDEQVIGTWIDGKPLYQKTVHISALPSTAFASTTYPHNIANVDKICGWDGTAVTADGTATAKFNVPQFNSSGFVKESSFVANVTKTDIAIIVGANRSTWTSDFTIQYTKTTD